MNINLSGLALGALLSSLVATNANAVTYAYTGSNFVNCSGVYSGCTSAEDTGTFTSSLTLDQLKNLGAPNNQVDITSSVTSFSFSDAMGLTLTESNTTVAGFDVSTNSSGQLTSWSIGLYQTAPDLTVGFTTFVNYIEIFNNDTGPSGQIVDDAFTCGGISSDLNCPNPGYANTSGSQSGIPGVFTIAGAPEPHEWALLLAGMFASGHMLRRLKRRTLASS